MNKTNTKQFFKELLTLCQKHKVNMQGTVNYKDIQYQFDATGEWDISKENDALVAEEVISTIKNTVTLKGDYEM